MLCSCTTGKNVNTESATGGVLIAFYDTSVGCKPLLKAIKSYHAKILYRYKNFNAIAFSIPAKKKEDDAIAYFQKVKGVLTVNKDTKVELQAQPL
jgi:hypothetical protein